MRHRKDSPEQRPSLRLCIVVLVLISLLWIVFVGGVRRDEMIVGVGVLFLSSGFLYLVWRSETLNLDLELRDLAQGWRVLWYVPTDIWIVIAVLVKDLFRVKRAGSFYRVSRFETSESEPRLVARRVLATFYTTLAPNSIVIGIDFHRNRMLLHQLKRSNISKMAQALGAESGEQRS